MEHFIDIFKNSKYLNKFTKDLFNEDMYMFFYKINKYLSSENLEVNLYLSGSLARQEPSIYVEGHRMGLYSDIDFILVSDSEKPEKINNFKEWLLKTRPDINSTIQLVYKENFNNIQGCFVTDLMQTIDYPIFKSFKIDDFTFKKTNKEHLLENIIHQISGYLLYPPVSNNTSSFFRGNKAYHHYKLILECLRAQLIDEELIGSGYHQVYKNRFTPYISELMSPKETEFFIKRREIFTFEGIEEFPVFEFLRKSLLIHLDLSPLNNNFNEIFKKLEKRIQSHNTDELDLYKTSCIIFSLIFSCSMEEEKDSLFGLFSTLFINIDKVIWDFPDLNKFNDFYFLQNSYNYYLEHVLVIFRKFHSIYLKKMTERNLGYLQMN
ncbi:hypothetical protein COJ07_01045 [Bacillus cereus]|uniref:Uncharacterized protein n=1 Tax=Bacillus cereus TaxID=1396 RepID=A0A2B3TVT0_BACCE|nr:hypothetical protein [Bacillus cereus]PFL25296.1 hypothetical protein COJ07_01045 [Bacillus cereus]PFU38514.1 hypothetical protein COK86_25385 [Bacillus cereus]